MHFAEHYKLNLARNIKAHRERASLTQMQVAEAANLNYRHYQRIEGGRLKFTSKFL